MCGVLEDVPDGSDLRMELSGGSVRLHGTLPRARWAGAAIVASSLHADRNEVPWPAAEEGEPAPATDMPDAWPAGPLRVSVILLWDTSFAVLSQMARAPDTA